MRRYKVYLKVCEREKEGGGRKGGGGKRGQGIEDESKGLKGTEALHRGR